MAAADHDFVVRSRTPKPRRFRSWLPTIEQQARGRQPYTRVLLIVFFTAAAIAIPINALLWQKARHPAPLFGKANSSPPPKPARISEVAPVPVPRRQPAAAVSPDDKQIEKLLEQTAPAEPEMLPPKPRRDVDSPSMPGGKALRPLMAAPPNQASRGAAPVPEKAITLAQRALMKLGFVLRPDGIMGDETRTAIEGFQRNHKLPVTGKLTPALERQLSLEAGTSEPR
ncbi:MAG TPA: peptidoglycan-binding protein [Methylocella sp.]|nr:peptidoglycan-binding protein [Methylocella sp.]